jgi:hypothetical protein
MNLTTNYDGSGSFATDDLLFNNTSVLPAAATADIVANSITIAATYSGTWSFSGQSATLAAGFSDDGITGAHTFGTALICNGASATVHFGTGSAITASSCTLTLNGTTGMTYDHDSTSGKLASIVLGAGAKVTVTGAGGNAYASNLTTGAGATITNNVNIRVTCDTTTPFVLGAGTVLNGAGGYYITTGTSTTCTLPAITITGTAIFLIYKGTTGAMAVTFGGNIVVPGDMYIRCQDATGAMSVVTNNYAISCSALIVGNQTAGASLTFNRGSSVITCSSYTGATYNTAGCTDNWQTSSMICSGAFTMGSNQTYNPGTSLVTFTGTGTTTLNGKSLYDVVVNSSGLTRTIADSLTCNSITRTAGVLTFSAGANLVLTGAGGLSIAAVTGNCTFQNVTFSAANANLTQNGAGTVGMQTVTFSLYGQMVIGSNTTVNKLVFTDGYGATQTGAGILTVTTNAAGDWSGSAGSVVTWVGPGKIAAPAGVTVTYMDVKQISNATGTTIDATSSTNINRGGNTNWNMVGATVPSTAKGSSLCLGLALTV